MVTVEDITALPEFQSDYEFFESTATQNDELDLSFLEAIEESESLFAINASFYQALEKLKPEAVFIPSLEDTIFEQPLPHAVWTCNSWPETEKHFPA